MLMRCSSEPLPKSTAASSGDGTNTGVAMAAVPAATLNDGDELESAVAIMFPRSMMRRGTCPADVPDPPSTTLKFTPGVLRDAGTPATEMVTTAPHPRPRGAQGHRARWRAGSTTPRARSRHPR